MGHKMVNQTRVVAQAEVNKNQTVEDTALFDENGVPFSGTSLAFAPIVIGTAIGTAAKTTASDAPKVNSLVPLKFTNGNSAAAVTVAFDGGSAIPVLLGGSAPTGAELTVAAQGVAMFFFDGTNLHQLGVYA